MANPRRDWRPASEAELFDGNRILAETADGAVCIAVYWEKFRAWLADGVFLKIGMRRWRPIPRPPTQGD